MTENQRLKILQKELGFKTQVAFGNALNLSPGTMSDIFRQKEGVGVSDATKRILEKSYNVSMDWFENGLGEMFTQNVEENTMNEHVKGIKFRKSGQESIYNENLIVKPKPNIPMYNFPGSASDVEMYGDPNEVKVIGYLNIPGAIRGSFALPVYGHSMYPTLENGSWGVLREISDKTDVGWGEIYYIEYGDYRQFKRLLKDEDNPENVILWSDNQSELINNRPKYASKTIKLSSIRKLCLLTDILKKPNY